MPVAKDVQIGRDVRIFHPDLVNLYGCVVGDETRIGTFVEIQAGAKIGARCKISSHSKSMMWEPMNPAPPVTRTRFPFK
jgi:UDP-3-O-[3-hydroxymyristoyl] glucosamine N-acyltransferase